MAQQTRLTWLQKWTVRKVMKKAKKKLKEQQKKVDLTANEREQLLEAIQALNKLEIFDLLDDNDQEITIADLHKMKTPELTEILGMQIKELEQWV